jgi:hypothetical protein
MNGHKGIQDNLLNKNKQLQNNTYNDIFVQRKTQNSILCIFIYIFKHASNLAN